ncbi:GNAT family N-acetyltransferase [Sporolactobacillus kofuensis]|uniref:GNAT family N-acetyltransferase n=1 Tax=Sporolactobacillus kofuensis TaxID=269672 RepID=A0ABW1WH57_9BACL|nr:GNAT family N-acetyltransferase [Sporolactobacillus kofuensis]MCO7176636.1 GNAT family N-acetyltransferase [Sporolactobacillus kofuensis]
MLIRYKKSYEKIAMGLLSFIPSEKEIKLLLQTVKKYEEEDSWQLFLWKDDEDILGVIGIQMISDDEAVIEHISVNPSYRAEGVGKKMIFELGKLLGDKIRLAPSQAIQSYFDKCFEEGDEKETNS